MPNIECAVCSEEFGHRNDTRVVITTPCGHVFHEPCLSKWLQYGIKLDEPPKTCPECRQSVTMSTTRRIYFNFSTVVDNVSEYIEYLNSMILDRNNKLHIANMQLKNIECELQSQLRTKALELQGLTDKLQHLKMEYNKLKHIKQDLPKQLHEKIGKLKLKLKESKHKSCPNCQTTSHMNVKDTVPSSSMNGNIYNQTPQFNPIEAISPMCPTITSNNCDLSTSIFSQNMYTAQSSRTLPTLEDITEMQFSPFAHPFTQNRRTQIAYSSPHPLQTITMHPSVPTTPSTQQQPLNYSQNNFFLPTQTTDSFNATYFNAQVEPHYIG